MKSSLATLFCLAGVFMAIVPAAHATENPGFPYQVGDLIQVQKMEGYQPVGPIITMRIDRIAQWQNAYLYTPNGFDFRTMSTLYVTNPGNYYLAFGTDHWEGNRLVKYTSSSLIYINGVLYNGYFNNQALALSYQAPDA